MAPRRQTTLFGRVIRRVKTVRKDTSYLRYKPAARAFILTLLHEYALREGFTIGRVAIRDTKRRWGSCSARGHLNFSYKLLLLPPCMARYIVVHELCHLRQLNHSHLFWQEVAGIMPDYAARMERLRHHERTAGTSIRALQHWQHTHDADTCSWCRFDDGRE